MTAVTDALLISGWVIAAWFWYDARWWKKHYSILEGQLRRSLDHGDELMRITKVLVADNEQYAKLIEEISATARKLFPNLPTEPPGE